MLLPNALRSLVYAIVSANSLSIGTRTIWKGKKREREEIGKGWEQKGGKYRRSWKVNKRTSNFELQLENNDKIFNAFVCRNPKCDGFKLTLRFTALEISILAGIQGKVCTFHFKSYSETHLVGTYLEGDTKSEHIIRGTYYQGWFMYLHEVHRGIWGVFTIQKYVRTYV